jgi:hypothetical protein
MQLKQTIIFHERHAYPQEVLCTRLRETGAQTVHRQWGCKGAYIPQIINDDRDGASHGTGLHLTRNKMHQPEMETKYVSCDFHMLPVLMCVPHTLLFYKITLSLWVFSCTPNCDISVIFVINYCTCCFSGLTENYHVLFCSAFLISFVTFVILYSE